jgi:hypothetical protein
LSKYVLNSDSQQFHQYQQNEQSPLTSHIGTDTKNTTTYDIGNPGPCLGQTPNCGGVKSLNGI